MKTTETTAPTSRYGIRITTIGILIALGTILFSKGTIALPTWIRALTIGRENGDLLATKLVIGLCLFFIGAIVVLGRRGATISLICATLLAFSGVAECTATLAANGTPDVLSSAIQLLAAALIFGVHFSQSHPSPEKTSLSGFSIITVFGWLVVCSVVSANLSPPNTAVKLTKSVPGSILVHTFEPDDWPGQTLLETGLLEHVPALGTLARIGGPTVVVFYRQNCGMCHDVFKEELQNNKDLNVIAIEVPPGKDVEAVESSLPEDIDCQFCTRLSLAEGPLWLVETPLVVSIVDDSVTCIASPREEDRRKTCIADTFDYAANDASAGPQSSVDQQLPSR